MNKRLIPLISLLTVFLSPLSALAQDESGAETHASETIENTAIADDVNAFPRLEFLKSFHQVPVAVSNSDDVVRHEENLLFFVVNHINAASIDSCKGRGKVQCGYDGEFVACLVAMQKVLGTEKVVYALVHFGFVFSVCLFFADWQQR